MPLPTTEERTIFHSFEIHRKYPTVDVPVAVLEDQRLRFKSKGVLAYLLSKPSDWRACIAHLAKVGPDGRDSVTTAINELERLGYMARIPIQNPKTGMMRGTVWHVYDYPMCSGSE
jgi:hypothetical protein